MKIKITKEQARILENLNKGKVIKITESQYKQLLESQGVEESALIKPIFNAISKVDAKAGSEYKRNVSSETRIKGVLHEDLWKEFVNELYGLNESGKNIYEKLIKIMEACGYVENRKISKTIFEGDKELAKKVISSGLNKLHESGSPYMAMETMEEAFKSEKKNPFFKTFVDDWFAKGNENVQVQKYYDNGDYWMAWQLIRRIGNIGKMPQNPSDMEVVSISEYDDNLPMGAKYNPDAPWNQKDPQYTKQTIDPNKSSFVTLFYDGELAILKDASGTLYHLMYDGLTEELNEIAKELGFAETDETYYGNDEDGMPDVDIEYYYNWEGNPDEEPKVLSAYANENPDSLTKIDDTEKEELLYYYKNPELINILNSIEEVTAMGGASPVFGGPGGFPVGKLKSVDEYNIYEALNTLKKK